MGINQQETPTKHDEARSFIITAGTVQGDYFGLEYAFKEADRHEQRQIAAKAAGELTTVEVLTPTDESTTKGS